jgi:hypothetical protein
MGPAPRAVWWRDAWRQEEKEIIHLSLLLPYSILKTTSWTPSTVLIDLEILIKSIRTPPLPEKRRMYQPDMTEAGSSKGVGHLQSPQTETEAALPGLTSMIAIDDEPLDIMPTRVGRKLCVRHKQMANQNVNQKLQRVSLARVTTAEGLG